MTEDYRNTIFNEDCSTGLDRIPNGSIDLVMMDPPYELGTNGGGAFGSDVKQYHSELEPISKGITDELLDKIVSKMRAVNLYVWCNKNQIYQYLRYFEDRGGCTMDMLTWHKTNPVPACGNKYLSDTEYCLFFREKGVKLYGSYETKHKYYVSSLNTNDKRMYDHPTIKPLDFVKALVGNSLPPKDAEHIPIVLDPFMGSGTTAVAAKQLGYDYVGFEIVEDYCNTAKQRIDATPIPGNAATAPVVKGIEEWGVTF